MSLANWREFLINKQLMHMGQLDVLNTELRYMKSEISDIKTDMGSLKSDIKNGFDDIKKILKEEYVNKLEFDPYTKKLGKIEKALTWVVGFILASVIGAVLGSVIIK